jgi:hypothetical protein
MAKENPTEAITSSFLLFVAAVRPLKIASSEKSTLGNTCDTGKSVPSSEPAQGCNALMLETRNRPLKRWISRDPFKNAEMLPEGPNIYNYVGNNSVNKKDSTGLFAAALVCLDPPVAVAVGIGVGVYMAGKWYTSTGTPDSGDFNFPNFDGDCGVAAKMAYARCRASGGGFGSCLIIATAVAIACMHDPG